MNITQILSDYVFRTKYKDLPSEVIHEIKRSLLNIIGVGIGASQDDSVNMILNVAKQITGGKLFTIWGRKEKTDLLFSTLINGTTSHMYDFDDTHFETGMHPAASVAPVVFALGEAGKYHGMELLLALFLGIEISCRIAKSIYISHSKLGWHSTGTIGTFGAASAASRLLGLNIEEVSHAFGLAGAQASGIHAMFGTMTKPFHAGNAAKNGLFAALLAKQGFKSSSNVLENPRGYLNAASREVDLGIITKNLGDNYEILNIGYKPYACGYVAHPLIEGIIRLKNRYNLKPSEIKKINCFVNWFIPTVIGKKDPKSGLESKFSAYHCVAVALIDGLGGQLQFTNDRVIDKKIGFLRKKVHLIVKHGIKRNEAIIEVELVSGKNVSEHIRDVKGGPSNPLSDSKLEDKFKSATGSLLPVNKKNKLIDMIWNLEEYSDLKEVINNIIP